VSRRIRVEVYGKDFAFRGLVGNPIHVTVIPKWFLPGLATFSIPIDHRQMGNLVEIGARVVFRDTQTKDQLLSGWVARYRVSGPAKTGTIEFDVVDDFIILQYILGWVVPSAAITAQGTAGTNWTMTGPAETVIKEAMRLNGVERLGLPIYMAPSLGRGAQVKARLRFQSLYDRLIPVEDGAGIINSGIGVGVRQREDAPGLELYVWEPRTIPQVFKEQSRVVTSWAISHENATVTRAVAGGEGEGQLRLLRERVETSLEASLGWKREVFRDARDTGDPNEMYERADETIAEGGAKSGLTVELSEAANFQARPGKIWIGDQLTMSLGGINITERLQEVTLSETASGGYTSRPRIGDRSDDPDVKLGKIVRNVLRKLRIANSQT